MQNTLSDNAQPSMKRRRFVGYLLASAAGGLFVGTILRRLVGRKKTTNEPSESIRISANPLAVPRRKEGSKRNV